MEKQQCKSCPVCGENRYKPDSVVPRKSFKYYPITDRIKRLFGNSYSSVAPKPWQSTTPFISPKHGKISTLPLVHFTVNADI
jgi:hypothetical protein